MAEKITKRNVVRKDRNRRRRIREHLDRVKLPPPRPRVRRLRKRPPEWHGLETWGSPNRKYRRKGSLPVWLDRTNKARGERRRQRRHRRLMARR